MKKIKKGIAMCLTAVMAFSMMSVGVFAQNIPVDENTGVEFPNKAVSSVNFIANDGRTRSDVEVTGEVWIYWNDWNDTDNLPSAYGYSIASQSIYKVGAHLACNSNGTSVENTGWKYMYNTSAANSGTLQATHVQCVFDATGRFQYASNTEIAEGTHQERFPKSE